MSQLLAENCPGTEFLHVVQSHRGAHRFFPGNRCSHDCPCIVFGLLGPKPRLGESRGSPGLRKNTNQFDHVPHIELQLIAQPRLFKARGLEVLKRPTTCAACVADVFANLSSCASCLPTTWRLLRAYSVPSRCGAGTESVVQQNVEGHIRLKMLRGAAKGSRLVLGDACSEVLAMLLAGIGAQPHSRD